MVNTSRCCCLLVLSWHAHGAFAALEGFAIVTKVDRYNSASQKKAQRQHPAAAAGVLLESRRRQTRNDTLQEEDQRSRHDQYEGTSHQSSFPSESGDPVETQGAPEESFHDDFLLSSSSSVDLPPPTTRQLRRFRGSALPWLIPILGCFVSYKSFGQVSRLFLNVVQWASAGTWIPQTREDIDLQASVVTQVVNGPVITSVSVLFAALVSLTVSKLHSIQVDVHKSLVMEVHYLRELTRILNSKAVSTTLDKSRLLEARKIIAGHVNVLYSSQRHDDEAARLVEERKNPHQYIESTLPDLIAWTIDYDGRSMTGNHWDEFVRRINADIRRLAQCLMEQRCHRWMALHTAPFPMVHYLTLTLLAVSIMISFLVATAQAEFIFLNGSPVRVLWSLLTTSFLALALVCFDLAQPFGGAYHIP